TKVLNNYIGLGSTGGSLGNVHYGVILNNGASNNIIGGTLGATPNVISGNGVDGVAISGSNTARNIVRGNLIGTNVAGTAAIANAGNGVTIDGASTGNTVGGVALAARNV